MNDKQDAGDMRRLRLDSLREEQLLVAHAIHDPRLAKKIAMQIDPEDLYDIGEYKEAITAIIDASNNNDGNPSRSDIIAATERILRRTTERSLEFASVYREAQNDTRNGLFYLRRVIDRAGRRRMMAELNPEAILQDTWNVTDAVSKAREVLLDVSRKSAGATGRGGLLRKDYHDNVEALSDRLDGKVEIGFDTGFTNLDSTIGQFKASSYNIIGARPSIGKTAVSVNLVLAMARRGIRVLFITLEVPYDAILELMACCFNGLRKELIRAKPLQSTRQRLSETYEAIHKLPIELHANCGEIGQIIALCEDAITRQHQPVQAIFIDYAQIIRTRQRTRTDLDRLNIVSEAFRQLKSDHKVMLFLASQLNRKSADGIPKLEDLKGSGDFEQDADTVVLLHRPNKEASERESGSQDVEQSVYDDQMDMYIRKNRHGRTGRVSFHWDGATGVISEMSQEARQAADRARDGSPVVRRQAARLADGSLDSGTELPF